MADELINYVYISKAKIDKFFPQIPTKLLDKYLKELNIRPSHLIEAKDSDTVTLQINLEIEFVYKTHMSRRLMPEGCKA